MSAVKFHYIGLKAVSGKVVAQSIAFRLVSIYWQHGVSSWFEAIADLSQTC